MGVAVEVVVLLTVVMVGSDCDGSVDAAEELNDGGSVSSDGGEHGFLDTRWPSDTRTQNQAIFLYKYC